MTRIADQRSILGIDPTSRGLAFVFFENGTLLDWGTRRKDEQELDLLAALLNRYKADVLILEDPDAPRCERRPRMRRLLRVMRERASEDVTVLAVARHEVRRAWAAHGLTNKHGIAAMIAAMFPEVEPLVPRRRKPYQSDQARADIFDAISLVMQACGGDPEAGAA